MRKLLLLWLLMCSTVVFARTEWPGRAKSANTVLAGPTSGGDALPTFRALVAADLALGLTAGSVLFHDGTAIVEDNDELYFDDTNDILILGSTSAQVTSSTLEGHRDGADCKIRLFGWSDTLTHRGALNCFGVGGTKASPTATLNTKSIGQCLFGGYDGTSLVGGTSIWGQATENWSVGNNGAKLTFMTTAQGGTISDTWTMQDDGAFVPERSVGGQDVGTTAKELGDIYIGDNVGVQIGLDQDCVIQYDEATDDRVEVTGADWYMGSGVSVGLDDLTASRLTATDGSKNLSSVSDLTSWIAATANETSIANDGDGTCTIGLADDVIVPTSLTAPNTGLHLLDTGGDHDLIIAPGSDVTADRTLTVTTGDSNRTMTLSGNLTVESASLVNQDLTTDATPEFMKLVIGAGAAATPSIYPAGDANTGVWAPAADTLAWSTAGSERVRITSAGYIGFGGTPSYFFHAQTGIGDNVFVLENSNATGPYGMYIGLTAYDCGNNDSTHHFIACNDNSGTNAILYGDGDWYNQNGTYGTISDMRLKKQIEDAGNTLENVKALKYRKWKWKDGGAEGRGLVAQEVEDYFPHCVSEIEWNGKPRKAVSLTGFVPVLLRAVQELEARLVVLEETTP